MPEKAYYPIFVDVEGKLAVVVGGGPVALRKARGVLEAGARVCVISPEFVAEFDDLEVERVRREYRIGDLDGAFMAFAATDRREVNHAVASDAKAAGILANIADAPAECGFVVPARLRSGEVQIAISTGGTDPRKAAQVRAQLEAWLADG